MKVHRIVLSVIDFDDIGAAEVRQVLENANYPNDCINPSVDSVETADAGKWSDAHPLNHGGTAAAEMARLFPARELTADDVRAAGGIVHSDGNIFFTNIGKLNTAIKGNS